MKKFAFLGVLVLFALFGSTFTITKVAMEQTSITFLLGFRMLIAGIGLIFYSMIFQKQKLFVAKDQWIWVVALSLTSFLFCNLFEFWGLQFLSSSKACFIYGLTPFITAFFSFLLFKERLSMVKIIGLFLGPLAYLPTFFGDEFNENQLEHFGIFSLAELALVAATTCAVLGWIILKKIGEKKIYSIPMMNGQAMALCGVVSLALSFINHSSQDILVKDWSHFLISVFALIIVSNFICYNLYGILLRSFSATFMSIAGFLTPLFAAMWGYLFLDESITWSFFYSLFLTGLALFLFYSQELLGFKSKDKMLNLLQKESI